MDVGNKVFFITSEGKIVKTLEDCPDACCVKGVVVHPAKHKGHIGEWYTMFIYKTYKNINDALRVHRLRFNN